MNEVEKVRTICKERHIPISRLEKDCGFCNGYIGQLKKGVFPSDRLMKIAKYLDVSLSDLSESAVNMPVDYMYRMEDGTEVLIEANVKKAMEGPFRDRMIAYAKKLNELSRMENIE